MDSPFFAKKKVERFSNPANQSNNPVDQFYPAAYNHKKGAPKS